eukprot:3251938-Amphidinium_carterae.1
MMNDERLMEEAIGEIPKETFEASAPMLLTWFCNFLCLILSLSVRSICPGPWASRAGSLPRLLRSAAGS